MSSCTVSEPLLKVAIGAVPFFAVSGASMAARIVAGALVATLMSALVATLSMYIESSRAPACWARKSLNRGRTSANAGRLMIWKPKGVSTRPVVWPGLSAHAALSKAGTNRPRGPGGRKPLSARLPGSSDSSTASCPKLAPLRIRASAASAFFRLASFTSGVALALAPNRICWNSRMSGAS